MAQYKEAYISLGEARKQLGDWKGALSHYEQAFKVTVDRVAVIALHITPQND
jgi:hypothetical protein